GVAGGLPRPACGPVLQQLELVAAVGDGDQAHPVARGLAVHGDGQVARGRIVGEPPVLLLRRPFLRLRRAHRRLWCLVLPSVFYSDNTSTPVASQRMLTGIPIIPVNGRCHERERELGWR